MKIKGTVVTDPGHGQVTTTFDKNPELPFSELKVQLDGGCVANPNTCGEYHAESVLTPWTAPFGEAAERRSSFPYQITGCQAPFAATMSNQAGGYSTLGRLPPRRRRRGPRRADTAPGSSGNLSKVQLCGEPQASQAAVRRTRSK